MGYLKVEYDPNHKQVVYAIRFNPNNNFSVEESAAFSDTFEGCVAFVVGQFTERTRVTPNMQPFALEIKGDLPPKQRKVLEGIVELHNRSPELYQTFADPSSFRNLAEYFGQSSPVSASASIPHPEK